MLELAPNDPLIKTYLKDLQHLKSQSVTHELGLKGPFQTLLDKAAKRRGWTLVPELSTYSGGKRVVPDGTVRDEFRLARGWWEAKDTSDKLASEIQKKLKAGYPARNTIFEDTEVAGPGPADRLVHRGQYRARGARKGSCDNCHHRQPTL